MGVNDGQRRPSHESDGLTSENSPRQSTKSSRRYPSRPLRPTPANNHPRQAAAHLQGAQKPNPFIGAVRSKKSALDIESDLFAGIKSEAPEPQDFSKESPDMINSLVSAFGRDFLGPSESISVPDATGFTTSHSKLAQPLRLPPTMVKKTLAEIRQAETSNGAAATPATATPGGRIIPQLQFMSARARPAEVEVAKPAKPKDIDSLMFDPPESRVRRVESSEWTSSSRESWNYEVNVKEEGLGEEPDMMKAALENYLTPDQEKSLKKKELTMLKKRAKAAKFRLSIKDLAHWQPEVHKTEAPVENKTQNTLYIPPSISVVNFSNLLKVPLGNKRL
jgi:hypothetical protein